MSDSGSRRSRSPNTPAGAGRPATAQTALDALLSGTAGDPVRHAMRLDALDRQLRPLLPPALAAHARLANIDGGRLVFLVDSPVWHARLRLAAGELLDAARSLGLEVHDVVVKTASQRRPGQDRPPESAAPVRRTGRSADTDAALRAALASLVPPDDGGDEEIP